MPTEGRGLPVAEGISAARYAQRLERSRRAVAENGASALLVGVGAELEWLTGYAAHGGERLNLCLLYTSDAADED